MKEFKLIAIQMCCSYSYAIKVNMNKHVASVHEGKKPYKCYFCDHICSQQSDLNKHEGKKPFKCDICDYGCSTKGSMK